jgi:hypothetical protein
VWVYTKVPQTYFLLYWRRLTCEKVILTFIDSYCAREVSVGLYQSSSDLFPIVLEKSVWVYTKVPQTYFLLYWRRLTCEKVILTFIDSYCVPGKKANHVTVMVPRCNHGIEIPNLC